MTIAEQKRQIIIQQCLTLDSDLSENDKKNKLSALFKEFQRLKRLEMKLKKPKTKKTIDMSVRMTDIDTGEERFFESMIAAAMFLDKSASVFNKEIRKNNGIVQGYKYERRNKKYRYQKGNRRIEGSIPEIARRLEVGEMYIRALNTQPTKNISVVEIDRWKD
ncbi:hypothetical protein JZO76_07245 [Enterococcus sp. MJM12]|uniref:Phage protein n=1 Tax=Candidatus Enterococcus myersii TaxID=2815322 RepID=A0ABS3H7A4_9ENTE|nr:hypothetical protein [Enterococcus sp. MJM12]MBO0449334.1 hypothetical protein [Enterococcus sp. MJM12]